ncbi:uncharacterized protein MELLADRAFT_69035 [Melampsora larici-populina 98AG31]|uniref:Uncharacterized protein n=1 Tax=Melampsora larici-populina (strain 98AG31 / pathotype 3-4-7) TaxID=747676 RepID=F4S964_MELLP|nr:uncharacterized protein MELLADRAFT_69035 [Melampsora larici-populina 98AG31]EGF98817.1 hypothetical protein MELLADRAFT_69035 [Melampsora larici-populina 98AG31]
MFPNPQGQNNQPPLVHAHTSIADLPPPIHIYDIPVHLRHLVTLDLSVLHHRTTTTENLRDSLKCFYHTIPHVRMLTKSNLIESFIYYIVPILRSPKVFDEERGILYIFDVPFLIELGPDPDAGEANNDGNNGAGATA